MGKRLGIICGAGDLPSQVCDEIRKKGLPCIIAAIKGHADPSLAEKADLFGSFGLDAFFDFMAFLKRNGVKEVVFAGKIDQAVIYRKDKIAPAALELLKKGPDKGPESLIKTVIEFLESQGIAVLDPSSFLDKAFCEEGFLSSSKPARSIEPDIDFGWKIARQAADLDIGQTIVVKDRAVVAVEGMEGTDKAIERAGVLAGPGCTVVKVSRTDQDPRIDLPAVGLGTVKTMVAAGCAALCIEAGRMPFFQKEEAIALAGAHDIVILAKKA